MKKVINTDIELEIGDLVYFNGGNNSGCYNDGSIKPAGLYKIINFIYITDDKHGAFYDDERKEYITIVLYNSEYNSDVFTGRSRISITDDFYTNRKINHFVSNIKTFINVLKNDINDFTNNLTIYINSINNIDNKDLIFNRFDLYNKVYDNLRMEYEPTSIVSKLCNYYSSPNLPTEMVNLSLINKLIERDLCVIFKLSDLADYHKVIMTSAILSEVIHYWAMYIKGEKPTTIYEETYLRNLSITIMNEFKNNLKFNKLNDRIDKLEKLTDTRLKKLEDSMDWVLHRGVFKLTEEKFNNEIKIAMMIADIEYLADFYGRKNAYEWTKKVPEIGDAESDLREYYINKNLSEVTARFVKPKTFEKPF